MGINAQDVIAQDPDMLRKQLYQREMQQLNPSGDVFGTIGALLGRGAANVSQGRGFFDVADPALRRVAKMNEYQQEAMQLGGGDTIKTLEALRERLVSDKELSPFTFKVDDYLSQAKKQLTESRREEARLKKEELSISQEAQMRKELADLGPTATEDQVLSVITKYGSPDKIIASLTAKQSREAALQQSRELAQQRIDMQRELVNIRRESQQKSFTPAQRRTDSLFSKEYNDYVLGGGSSTVQKNLGDLDKAIAILEKNPSATGKFVGVVSALGDTALASAYPVAAEAKDLVGGVAQSNLRAVLGGQFAMKEGEQLLARAYNPAAPTTDNLRRLKALREQIIAAAQAKEDAIDYYEEKGTLADFKRSSGTTRPSLKSSAAPAAAPTGQWRIVK
jgi:hypothetical protein